MAPPLILASQSPARLRLLQQAGFACAARPAHVDEEALKIEMRAANASAQETALHLARAKARKIDAPGALVIAADQMLERDGVWLDKPTDRAAAHRQILALAAGMHHLIVGAVLFQDGVEIWTQATRAALTMRALSAADIDAYLDRAGENALASVGGYQIEGIGVRLFSKVDGDLFTIQGLPLVELCEFLDRRGFGLAAS